MSPEDYPSLLWIVIPAAVVISAFFGRQWYLAQRLRKHGIGKGAPGFQTSVRKVRVTPEIAARIRRGEEVSPEEIAAASAQMEREEQEGHDNSTTDDIKPQFSSTPTNEWLPDHLSTPKKRSKGKKR